MKFILSCFPSQYRAQSVTVALESTTQSVCPVIQLLKPQSFQALPPLGFLNTLPVWISRRKTGKAS